MSGDVQTNIAGLGGKSYDIYTKKRPGPAPPPPVASLLLTEGGDNLTTEGGDHIAID